MLIRIIISAVLLIALQFVPMNALGSSLTAAWGSGALKGLNEKTAANLIALVLYLIPYVVIGYDILLKAWKGIRNRQVFDENFLMAIATAGAIAIAIYDQNGEYTEAIAVMLFYQVGEFFQSYAVGKSRRNISELMDIRPDYANVEKDGRLEQVRSG